MNERDVVIVGAGPTGLALSLFLSRLGIRSTVVERRAKEAILAESDHRSVNLTLSGRGTSVLDELGLFDELKKVGVPIVGRTIHLERGICFRQDYSYGGAAALLGIERSAISEKLIERVEADPLIELRFSSQFLTFDKYDSAAFLKGPGEKEQRLKFSLLVGADGVFSKVRQEMLRGEPIGFRSEFFDWEYVQVALSPHCKLSQDRIHFWPGKDYLMLAIPNHGGTISGNLFFRRKEQEGFSARRKDLSLSAFVYQHLNELASDHKSIIEQLNTNKVGYIVQVRTDQWFASREFQMAGQPQERNVVLIGDAAHGMYHFMGQGLNSNLEDCRILSKQILRHLEGDEFSRCAKVYQEIRQPNTDSIADMSEKNFHQLRGQSQSSWYMAGYIAERVYDRLLGRKETTYELITSGKFSVAQGALWIARRKFTGLLLGEPLAQAVCFGFLTFRRWMVSPLLSVHIGNMKPVHAKS